MTPAPVLIGVVIAAFGVHGKVRVKSFASDPLALGNYGPLAAADGRRFEIVDLRRHRGDELILGLSGVATRDAAQCLKGVRLYVPRAALPEAAAGEYYHADLVDLRAETTDGREIGRVSAVLNFGAGDILEITRVGGAIELIPFNDACVPVVDFAIGRVVVDAAAANAESG